MSDTVCPTCSRGLYPDEIEQAVTLCGRCLRAIRGWLAELPAQLVVLRGSRLRETSDEPRVGGSRTAPLPGRIDVLNLLGPHADSDVSDPHGDQTGPLPVAGVLGSWVRLVVEERRLRGPHRGEAEQLAAWLDPHLAWAANQPWAGEMHHELQTMMRAIRGITRVRPRTRAIPRPCPRCDSLALLEQDHQQYIECGVCGSLFTPDDLALDAQLRIHRQEHEPQETAA